VWNNQPVNFVFVASAEKVRQNPQIFACFLDLTESSSDR
jgi:hypothetical protein